MDTSDKEEYIKYLQDSYSTIKGHLTKSKQKFKSTKRGNEKYIDTNPVLEQESGKSPIIFSLITCINDIDPLHRVYTDQTGLFPVQ